MDKFVGNSGVYRELSNAEQKCISGGSEFTEWVTEVLGYGARLFRDIEWRNSSWFNGNIRAQR